MDLYRIILVDDEEEVRKSIIRKIDWQAVGFTVVGDAENGEDALEKIEALEPDVVLTDIRMPYMDGLTLAEKIRQRYPSMKIVIFSGYDDFDYAKRDQAECDGVYFKARECGGADGDPEEDPGEPRRGDRAKARCEPSAGKLQTQPADPARAVPKGSCEPPDGRKTVNDRLEQYDIPLAERKVDLHCGESGNFRSVRELILPLHEERELIPISVMQILEENLKPYCRFSLFSFSGGGRRGDRRDRGDR